MLPDPVPFPPKDPLVVKIHNPAIFVIKSTKVRIWGITFGGDEVRLRARAVALRPNRTTIIEGEPITAVVPPASFGFLFDPLPLQVPIQIVVDARDKDGRSARDVVNLIAVGLPVTAFDITIDAVDNRSQGCDVYAYGSANASGSTLDAPTDIRLSGQTVNGSDATPSEWWDWAVRFGVPPDFPHGSATLRVTRTVVTQSGNETNQKSTGVEISDCGVPDPDTNGIE